MSSLLARLFPCENAMRRCPLRALILGSSIWMLVAMAGSCLAEDQAKEETPWYARPIVTDSETLALLDDIGANSVGFRFHLPSDHKLIVTILAKDEKGSRIEKLSGVHTLTPQEKGIPFD